MKIFALKLPGKNEIPAYIRWYGVIIMTLCGIGTIFYTATLFYIDLRNIISIIIALLIYRMSVGLVNGKRLAVFSFIFLFIISLSINVYLLKYNNQSLRYFVISSVFFCLVYYIPIVGPLANWSKYK